MFGTEGIDTGLAAAAAPGGDVLVAGHTEGTLPGQVSAGGYDVFLARFGGDGTPRWVAQFGTPQMDEVWAVTADAEGSAYLCGYTRGALDGTNQGESDAFVAKYSADGARLWAVQVGTAAAEQATALGLGPSGDLFVVGSTGGALDGTSAGDRDAFLLRVGPDGTRRWTRQLGTTRLDEARAVAVSAGGDVFLAGSTQGHFEGTSTAAVVDIFLAKYAPDGTRDWVRQIASDQEGSPHYDQAAALLAEGDDVLMTGATAGTLGQAGAVGTLFLGRFTGADGSTQWIQQFGTALPAETYGFVRLAAGGYAMGGFTEGVFQGQTAAGLRDAFVLRLSREGALLSARQFGSPAHDRVNALAVLSDGRVAAVGGSGGAWGDLVNAGGSDAFAWVAPADF
jgi:hypothetical protein